MRTRLHDPQSAIRNPRILQPFGELEGEHLAEKGAHADTGVKITATAQIVFFRFIVSMNGTVEGKFHETCEGQDAAFGGFTTDDFKQVVHSLRLAQF
jgi:hypothetical protein